MPSLIGVVLDNLNAHTPAALCKPSPMKRIRLTRNSVPLHRTGANGPGFTRSNKARLLAEWPRWSVLAPPAFKDASTNTTAASLRPVSKPWQAQRDQQRTANRLVLLYCSAARTKAGSIATSLNSCGSGILVRKSEIEKMKSTNYVRKDIVYKLRLRLSCALPINILRHGWFKGYSEFELLILLLHRIANERLLQGYYGFTLKTKHGYNRGS